MKNFINIVMFLLVAIDLLAQLETNYFKTIQTQRVVSDSTIEWRNFGPGMSGYCEEFWCHPTDTNAMFMGPDMHVSFGTWDNGKSWQTIKDSDGLGQDMKRVLDIEFSLQNADFGMALDWNGWIYVTTDRGQSWNRTGEFGKSYKDVGIDPNDPKSFAKGWYYEQKGTRHSELAVDPTNDDIWYVGAGDFWNVKSNHRSAAKLNGIKLNYAAYGYIWKTSDKGKTWQKITNGLPENTEVGKIIVNPNDPDSVIMATNVGLQLSGDGCLSWKISAKGLPNNLPRDLTSFYNEKTGEFVLYLVDQTVYEEKGNTVTSKGGVFISINGGVSWKSVSDNLAIDLNAISFPPEIERFYKTIGFWFGISGNEAKTKFPQLPIEILPVYNRIAINPLNKNEIYVSVNKKHDITFGAGDVWRTLDGGKSWISCSRHGSYWLSGKDKAYWDERKNPMGTNIEFAHLQKYMDEMPEVSGNRMLVVNAIGEIFIGIDQQTLKSSDHGNSWHQIDDYETSPGSKKWIGRGGSNLPGRYMLLETGIANRRLLCSGEHGLWQTTGLDGWKDKQAVAVEQIEGQNHSDGAHSISTVAVDPKNPNIIYTLAWRQEHRGKLRLTTNGGKTWENIATIFEKDNPELIYAALNDDNGGLYLSKDKGSNWEKVQIPAVIKAVNNVFIDRNNKSIYISTGRRNGSYEEGGVWCSSDNGTTWQQIFKAPFVWQAESSPVDPKLLVISVAGQNVSMADQFKNPGVYLSEDGGDSWKKINNGLSQPDKIVDVKPDPYNKDVLWCASWGSGWFIAYLNGTTDGWMK